jgi:hypothetical protein
MPASSAKNTATAARHARTLLEMSRVILFLPIIQLIVLIFRRIIGELAAPVHSDFPLVSISKTS